MRISDWSSDVCSSDLAKAKLEQSERDLNTYAREVGLIKTEQTNPDGSTSTGVGSVTTASLVQLNQATNEATASRSQPTAPRGSTASWWPTSPRRRATPAPAAACGRRPPGAVSGAARSSSPGRRRRPAERRGGEEGVR